jgi:hypothetical protein
MTELKQNEAVFGNESFLYGIVDPQSSSPLPYIKPISTKENAKKSEQKKIVILIVTCLIHY